VGFHTSWKHPPGNGERQQAEGKGRDLKGITSYQTKR
jgi:hypothetical protein